MSSALGSLSPRQIMQAADARLPARIWPSPPRFQNFMRKAGVSASATQCRMAISCSRVHTLRCVPKAPLNMVAYTLMGFRPVVMVVMKPQTTTARRMAPRRTERDCQSGSSLRLVMCITYASPPPSLVIMRPTSFLVAVRPSTMPLTLPPQSTRMRSQSSSSTSRSSPTYTTATPLPFWRLSKS